MREARLKRVFPATAAAVVALVLTLATGARAQEPGGLAREPLSAHAFLVTGAGSNVVVLESDAGLVLVDSGAPAHARALVAFLADSFDGKPVRAVFNTHWHPANTGANELLGAAGAKIIAHENTRLWMSTEYYVKWEQKNYEPRPAAAQPTDTFYSSDPQPLVLEHGPHRIEYGHLAEAHTDGDLYVRFPDENVIVVGDALAVDAFPVLDYSTGGWIGGLQGATQRLIELTDARTKIVASAGPPQSRAALEAQLEMLDTLHERIRLGIIAAKSVEEIVADDVAEGYESRGDPLPFVRNVYGGLWWGGRLRGAY